MTQNKDDPSGDERDTRNRIIDAAEETFSRKGFHGSTIREIFTKAGANRGLLSYYFSSKENLFDAAIVRRIGDFRNRFFVYMDGIGDGNGSIYDFCLCYIKFFFEMACDEDIGWQNYIRLLAQINASYDLPSVHESAMKFDFIVRHSMEFLSNAMPMARKGKIESAFLFLETSVSTLLTSGQLRNERLHEQRRLDHPGFAEEMASFYATAIKMHCI